MMTIRLPPPAKLSRGRLQVLARDVLRDAVECRDEEVRAMAVELLERRDAEALGSRAGRNKK